MEGGLPVDEVGKRGLLVIVLPEDGSGWKVIPVGVVPPPPAPTLTEETPPTLVGTGVDGGGPTRLDPSGPAQPGAPVASRKQVSPGTVNFGERNVRGELTLTGLREETYDSNSHRWHTGRILAESILQEPLSILALRDNSQVVR